MYGSEDKPVLFADMSPKSKEAFLSLCDSGIEFEFASASRDNSLRDLPCLIVGFRYYEGIREIKEYIVGHKAA